MSYWSIYIAAEEEKILKRRIEKIAQKHRWSFSQAVSGILREHLVEEKNRLPDDQTWALLAAQEFFEGYPEKDSIYDTL